MNNNNMGYNMPQPGMPQPGGMGKSYEALNMNDDGMNINMPQPNRMSALPDQYNNYPNNNYPNNNYPNNNYPNKNYPNNNYQNNNGNFQVANGGQNPNPPNPPNPSSPPNPPNPSPNQNNSSVSKKFEGNYIINVPVADGVFRHAQFNLEFIEDLKKKNQNTEEFSYLRYSAVTCDPNKFGEENFTLRQQFYKRETELFIVLTMYNEDEVLFSRSMIAVVENIKNMCFDKNIKNWGQRGWEKVVVCIVSDGRQKINKEVLKTLEIMGLYNENVIQNKINEKEVEAHVFEYTTQLFIESKENGKINEFGTADGYPPIQILFCLKENNKKKINSHRWFFNAFGRILKPNICVLIDVGTRPSDHSIYQLWRAFDKDPQIAGACGEIRCDTGDYCKNVWKNPLVAAQHFEYKMSNILDKPLESVFGYISVLPGAFSAYRYEALQGHPLEAYFKGETIHEKVDGNLFQSNMYLAEDRILCFELVAKKEHNYVLKYVRQAHADTDVPDNVAEFISQRRRWLNGSFFASLYSTRYWGKVYKTEHTLFRKVLFSIEFLYNLFNLAFSWFSLANFFLTFYFLAGSVKDSKTASTGINFIDEHGKSIFVILEAIYAYAMICIFTCSLGNRPQGSKILYLACIILFAIVMFFMLLLSITSIVNVILDNKNKTILEAFEDKNVLSMIISLGATWGLYLFSSIMYLQPWHMVNAFVQYMLLLPSFTNILMVYAFCNTHDVSWGTKGSTDNPKEKKELKINEGDALPEVSIANDELNKHYDNLMHELEKNRQKKKKEKKAEDIQDGKQNFRTYMVLSWIFCNSILLIVSIVIIGEKYLSFIFYSVLCMSAVRFIGSTVYILQDTPCCNK